MIGVIEARSPGGICKSSVAVVVVEDVRLAVVSHEDVVEAVVVVVPDANAVRPTTVPETGALGYVRKCAIVLVVIKVVDGFGAPGKTLQSAAVQDQQIRVAILVVVNGRDSAAGALPDIFLGLLSPIHHAHR